MKIEELKKKISDLTIWKKNGQRAPHKPLLILYALGQYQNYNRLDLSYEEVKPSLKKLLIEFGPLRQSYHPEEPFVRLEGDGIWKLNTHVNKREFSGRRLLTESVSGGFNQEVIKLFENNSNLIQEIVFQILEEHFPQSIHEDILEEVGLNFTTYRKKSRDPLFRERVLRAYEYSCAVCGFNVRLGQNLVGIEAAHIQWHQVGGPDTEDNGIALCSLHHKLFDRGVFTISQDRELLVSEDAHGTHGFDDWLMNYHGKGIRMPIRFEYQPLDTFIEWHVREVFRGPHRYK